ncbi:MAG: DUF1786 family protein [Candidatus Kariarchaeaceae archaeon]|jgi:uncharacterized protein (DUF1786 family)
MILSIDIGKGTEDILLVDPEEGLSENCPQAILPSQTKLLYQRLEKAGHHKHWYFDGEIMAGEPWHQLVYRHAKKEGNSVSMSAVSSLSLRYSHDQVISRGIMIKEQPPAGSITFWTKDIDWHRIDAFVNAAGYKITDVKTVLLACQDHGNPDGPGQSSRDYRMRTVYNSLQEEPTIASLLTPHDQVSERLPRHKALIASALTHFNHLKGHDIHIMDSSPAVVNGIDPIDDKSIIVNVGNGHTLVAILQSNQVSAIYETHTGAVTVDGISKVLQGMLSNTLTHDIVLQSGGHGLFQRKDFDDSDTLSAYSIYLIGPNRDKLKSLGGTYSYPISNMMMAGPVGLYRAYYTNYLSRDPKRS